MRSKVDQYIIDKIREMRISGKLSQEDFSIQLGFKSNAFVASIESNRTTKKYNINHVVKAAKIFDCSLWDIIPQYPI